MKTRSVILQAFACGALAASALAHDTWLIPNRFNVAPNSSVALDITSGMEFPKLDVGPKPERVASVTCRLAGKTFEITNKEAGAHSLQFKAQLSEVGIATFWITLPPRALELKPDQVKEYFDEVDAPEALRKQWAEMKPQRWRESYSKLPKTFARVGDPQSDRSWAEPVGLFLEIVPEKDPTMLQPGDEFPVHVLKDGQPFAGFSLNAVSAGGGKGETRKTDSAGRVAFKLEKAGRWLLRGTDIRKSSKPDSDWESDFATLTLEVGQK
ncbi:MAG: DUF4198 domain-containing protein [Chthoniobacterales bacterium]